MVATAGIRVGCCSERLLVLCTSLLHLFAVATADRVSISIRWRQEGWWVVNTCFLMRSGVAIVVNAGSGCRGSSLGGCSRRSSVVVVVNLVGAVIVQSGVDRCTSKATNDKTASCSHEHAA